MNVVGAISIFCVFDWLRDQNVSDGTRVKVTLIRDCVSLNIFRFVDGAVSFGGHWRESTFSFQWTLSISLFLFVFQKDL